ncbi:transcription termination factor 4, mitochondrial [Drosophila nasuta]|uniref:transcription termination factor 4, mitochondrial n=1 Tax=Drosophila nasuta TaxID=42062 RepID=UPI00295E8C5B|nr:transcription termination factor 4, mitochondrial [Drosophila nasuta]
MWKKIILPTTNALKQQQVRSKELKWTSVRQFAAKATAPKLLQLEQEHIDEAIKLEPTLSIYTADVWHRAHATFQNHGLQTVNFLRIVTGNPAVLKRTPQRIIESLEIWRSCQFGEHLLHLLLTKYPELLDVNNAHELRTLNAYLKSRVSTNKNVWKLLMNCPDLLAQSEHSMEQKLNYMIDVMRLEVPEIVKSAAMSLPFDELRCRHTFLLRLGLFKPRALKADPDEKTTNNRLYQITDTSEKAFATKICHVTLAEYEAFKELLAKELERKSRKQKTDDEEFSEDEEFK